MLKRYTESLRKILYVFNRKQKRSILVLIIEIIIGAVFELLGVTAILPFVSVAMSPETVNKNEYLKLVYDTLGFKSTTSLLVFLAVVLIAIFVIKNAYLTFLNYSIYKFIYSNQRVLAYRILKCYLNQPYTFFLNHNSADLMHNINTDVVQFFDIVLCLMQLAVEIIVCTLLAVYLVITDKTITVSIVFILGLYFLLFFKVLRKNIKLKGEIVRNCRIGMSRWLLQSFGGIKETKISTKEHYFLGQFDGQYEGFAENHCKYQTLSYIPRPLMETVVISAMLLVIVFKLLRGVDSTYFIGTISVFGVAAVRLLPAFNRISGYLSKIMFNRVSVDAVYEDLKNVEKLEKDEVVSEGEENIIFNSSIDVKNVTFSYPDAESSVLTDVSLTIPRNKSVAFVGPSGAGKTTMADIILGILMPQKGGITVDGITIDGNMTGWKKKLGYIPQAIFLMDDTIKNNIAYGVEEKDIDDARIEQVLVEAQLKEFIDTLPEGVDTVIGERGVRLSGGQRQRIGIARALYPDPEILVLDEATSALDTETETAVMEAIDSFSGRKTLLIIAHRLSTIENCDIIYEVKDNKVVKKR